MNLSKFGKLGIVSALIAVFAQPAFAQTTFQDISYFLKPTLNPAFWRIGIPLFLGLVIGWLFFFRKERSSKRDIRATAAKGVALVLVGLVAYLLAAIFSKGGGNINLGLTLGWIGFMIVAFLGIIFQRLTDSKMSRGLLVGQFIAAIVLSGIFIGPGGILREFSKILRLREEGLRYLGSLLGMWAAVALIVGAIGYLILRRSEFLLGKSEREEVELSRKQQIERKKRNGAVSAESQEISSVEKGLETKRRESDAKLKGLNEFEANADQLKTILQTNPASEALMQLITIMARQIPAYGTHLPGVNPLVDVKQVEAELDREIAQKQKVISLVKDNFAGSVPGKRAQYLLQLRENIRKNPTTYFGPDLSKPNTDFMKAKMLADTNDKELAEQISIYSGGRVSGDVRSFAEQLIKYWLEPRLRELIKQRTRLIKLNTADLNYLIKRKQTILKAYQGHDVSFGKTKEMIELFNQKQDKVNQTLYQMQLEIRKLNEKLTTAPGEAAAMIDQKLKPMAEEAKKLAQEESTAAQQGEAAAKDALRSAAEASIVEQDTGKKLRGYSVEESVEGR